MLAMLSCIFAEPAQSDAPRWTYTQFVGHCTRIVAMSDANFREAFSILNEISCTVCRLHAIGSSGSQYGKTINIDFILTEGHSDACDHLWICNLI